MAMNYESLLLMTESEEEKEYINLLVIRKFEENLLRLFGENKLFGTTHTCIGQEAIAVGVMGSIGDDDVIFSNHRCHGHFIAYSHHPEKLLKEIMGKTNSLCEGRGGSQHIYYRNFYTNGVQGGIVPNAVGAAFSEKRKNTNNIVVVFMGDGTLGQGVVYESLNMAKLLKAPVLFVVENNGYAMSTKTCEAVSGDIEDRAKAFGIETSRVNGNDLSAVFEGAERAIGCIRANSEPYMLICDTYRLAAHSKGDDFRPSEEIQEHRKHDPISMAAECIDANRRNELEKKVEQYITDITAEAENEDYSKISQPQKELVDDIDIEPIEKQKRYLDYINLALSEALRDPDTILMGEDIKDPYGGAFKVTKGLSGKYPNQVFNTPISEAAIAGVSVGASLNGTRVISEIMFGDFVTLTFDQLVNHASKYGWVCRNGKHVPMVLRTPMGGKRGYGPTHSQSLEKYLVGIPDINVVALSALHNPVYVYRRIMKQNNPTVVIENKQLYTKQLLEVDEKGIVEDFYVKKIQNYLIPTYILSYNFDYSNDLTIITYGGMLEDCMEAAKKLMIEDEIVVNIVSLGQLSDVPLKDLVEMKTTLGLVMFVEEGTYSYGIGGEIICDLVENSIGTKYARIAAPDSPLPNSLLQENALLPGVDTIIEKARSFVR